MDITRSAYRVIKTTKPTIIRIDLENIKISLRFLKITYLYYLCVWPKNDLLIRHNFKKNTNLLYYINLKATTEWRVC